nr:hypothetical protein [Tanacetum cinerariifolium]
MAASLRHQWRDTICGGVISPWRSLMFRMPPRRSNRVNNKADPAFTTAVAQAVVDLLATLTARITDEIRQNENNENNSNRRNARRVNTEVQGQYFPYSEKERCEREFKSICQLPEETSTDFMKRFLRLAGFLGAKSGTQEEQAKHFKWGLNDFVLDRILNIEFIDVAQVANAARNIKIFCDRPKNEGDNKKDRDGHRIRPSKTPSQGSNLRADDRKDSDRYGDRGRHGNKDRYGTERWRRDRKGSDRHGKACHRATGTCFECGEVGHLANDCKKVLVFELVFVLVFGYAWVFGLVRVLMNLRVRIFGFDLSSFLKINQRRSKW